MQTTIRQVINIGPKVIDKALSDQKRSLPEKRKSPTTPLRETDPLPEIGQGYKSSCLSRTGARTGERPHCRFLKRTAAAAVDEVLDFFAGSRVRDGLPGAPCDERLWGKICWRIGVDNFIEAVYCCSQDLRRHTPPLTRKERPRYFQAYLNRHFPKSKGGER